MIEVPRGKLLDTVWQANGRINLWHGSVRSAKTVSSLFAWLWHVTHAQPGPMVMVGQTFDTLRRNVIEPLEEMLGSRIDDRTRSYREVVICNRRIHCLGSSDVRAERKLRGLTLAGAYIDEASLVSEDFWNRCVDRMSVPGAKLFATTNPDAPTHWLRRKWMSRAAELDMRVFHLRLEDNPWLDPAYVAHVRASYSGVWFRRYVLGEWVTAEGAIWPDFDPQRHVTERTPKLIQTRVGVDYGTVNPCVYLFGGVGVDPDDPGPHGETDYARLYIAREWRWDSRARQRQRTDVDYSKGLREWIDGGYAAPSWQAKAPKLAQDQPERIVVDPSAASFIAQLQVDGHRGIEGADNRVQDGLRVVGSLFGLDRIRIHPSCEGLLEEIPGYGWDETAAAAGKEAPVKENDHSCLIAGTVVATPSGGRPIESVTPGDLVLTRKGPRYVLDAALTNPTAKVLRAGFSDGRSLVGTGDHPVWVEGQGWCRLDALRYGMIVACLSASDLAEPSSTATPSLPTSQPGPTSAPASETGRRGSGGSMRKCGWRSMGRSPQGITSTTPTSIPSTTTSPTLPVSPSGSIGRSMLRSAASARRIPPTWRRLVRRRRLGIAAKRVEPGTVSTDGMSGGAVSPFGPCASSAEPSTNPACRAGSAPTTARAPGGGPPTATTRNGPAPAAVMPSRSTTTSGPASAAVAVLSVTPLAAPAAVYDLTVDDAHEFYANGVLVSNCDSIRYLCQSLWGVWRHWTAVGR
jgi:PBSX family phage terminase large subunit